MKKFLLGLMAIVVIWSAWSYYDRLPTWKFSQLAVDLNESVTADSLCDKNIVGIQPYMLTEDYLSERRFYEKMKGYFELAKASGYFHANTVVLLPEYLGTWLVINGEKASVAETLTVQKALMIMVLSNPVTFARNLLIHQNEEDRFAATLFRMKSQYMAKSFGNTFKKLSQDYQVTIDAGSIILPGPGVSENEITVDKSLPLYNSSFIFKPGGEIDTRIIRKSFPIHSELPLITAAPIEEMPVFDLPIGKTVVLVCADSWFPESYDQLQKLGAEIVLVDSYCAGQNSMSQKWKGYDAGKMPPDVDKNDIYRITEREAWIRYALPGRINNTQAHAGVNIFLRGKLWDLGTDGQPIFVSEGVLLKTGKSNRAGIWNFCF